MNNIFRPSTAFPVVPDSNSVLHDWITKNIACDLERIAGEVLSKFPLCTLSKEDQEKTREAINEKIEKMYPSRYQIVLLVEPHDEKKTES